MQKPKMSRNEMFEIIDGRPIPSKVGDMEWILRYGDEDDILKHRYYIAFIISDYRRLTGDLTELFESKVRRKRGKRNV